MNKLKLKPVNNTRDRSWKTRIIGQKSKNYYNHLQGSVSYKDMADDNFTTNQKMLGNCVHRIENILLGIIRRMATIIDDRNDKKFSPLALGRVRDLGSFYLLTSLIPIRLKPR